MGGEKRATDIHASQRLSKLSLISVDSAPTVVQAEDKIQHILKARKTRQRRRSDISKALENSETMLMDSNSPNSFRDVFREVPDDLENLTIPLNDAIETTEEPEDEGGRRRRRHSGSKGMSPGRMKRLLKIHGLEKSTDKATQKKGNSSSSFLTKAAVFSPKSPGGMKRVVSHNSLRERLRSKLQGINYCDLNESDSDVSNTEGTSRVRRNAASAISDDDFTGDESDSYNETKDKVQKRSKSRQRKSRSKSQNRISRNQPDAADGTDPLKKPRSKSKNRIRSKSKMKSKRKPLKDDIETDDETSVGTKSVSIRSASTSGGRRAGRRPKNVAGDDSCSVDEDYLADTSCDFQLDGGSSNSFGLPDKSSRRVRRSSVSRIDRGDKSRTMDTSNSSIESPVVSPGTKKPKKRTKTKKASQEELCLGNHLESERSIKPSLENDNLSQVTEERSHDGSRGQQILLQFDPTNENLVRSVNQDNAKKTSEFIYGLHGTESKLEISELAGLPTFEKFNTSGSTSTTGSSKSSLNNSSHDKSPSFLGTVHLTPKMQGMSRSSSYVSPTSPSLQMSGELSLADGSGQNAQWGAGPSHSSRHGRSAGKNMFFNKKGVNGDFEKPARRSSDIGARTQSFGALMRIGGRHKLRDFGDGESLLQY